MNHHLDCVSFVAPVATRGHETETNRAQSQAPSSCEKIPLVNNLPNPAILPPHDRLGLSLELLAVFLLVSRLAALPLPLIFLSKNKSLKTINNHITYWLWRLSPFLSCMIYSFPVASNSTKAIQTRKHSETRIDGMEMHSGTRIDGIEMRQNLFMDLLAHERNRYQIFLSTDIKTLS
jgi:hypothetical protein